LLNEIYEVADLVDNFFVPTMKLKFKITDSRGASNKEGLGFSPKKFCGQNNELTKTPFHGQLFLS